MEVFKDVEAFYAKSRKEWRRWLEKHHDSKKAVWLIIYHKNGSTASVTYDESVEEALCFGWIDSIANKRDEQSKYQRFTPRNPKSNWSKSNRERIAKMTSQNLMTPAGQRLVDHAKSIGTWEVLEEVQHNVVPPDLQALLDRNPKALKHFMAFTPSSKRIILEWILQAKRPETRLRRIEETVKLATENIKANHYRQ